METPKYTPEYCVDCGKRGRQVLADRNGLCRQCYQNKSDADMASLLPRPPLVPEKPLPLPQTPKPFVQPIFQEKKPAAFNLNRRDRAPKAPTEGRDPREVLRQILGGREIESALELLERETEKTLEVLTGPKVLAYVKKLKPEEQAHIKELVTRIVQKALRLRMLNEPLSL